MKINKLILTLIAFSAITLPALGNSIDNYYCDGWRTGYTEGYQQTAGQPPQRMSPLCPLIPPGMPDDRKTQYDAGYQKGFTAGARDGAMSGR